MISHSHREIQLGIPGIGSATLFHIHQKSASRWDLKMIYHLKASWWWSIAVHEADEKEAMCTWSSSSMSSFFTCQKSISCALLLFVRLALLAHFRVNIEPKPQITTDMSVRLYLLMLVMTLNCLFRNHLIVHCIIPSWRRMWSVLYSRCYAVLCPDNHWPYNPPVTSLYAAPFLFECASLLACTECNL